MKVHEYLPEFDSYVSEAMANVPEADERLVATDVLFDFGRFPVSSVSDVAILIDEALDEFYGPAQS